MPYDASYFYSVYYWTASGVKQYCEATMQLPKDAQLILMYQTYQTALSMITNTLDSSGGCAAKGKIGATLWKRR